MKVTTNKVISIHYNVTDDEGLTVDSNAGYEPLEYIQGTGKMLRALEESLEGSGTDEIRTVMLTPGEAYGYYHNDLVVPVDKNTLQAGEGELTPGMVVNTMDGSIVEVVSVLPEKVIVNKNHPLAGKQLHFTIKVAGIRDATARELQSGYPVQPVETCGPTCSCHK